MLTPWQGPVRRIGPYRIIGRIGAGGMGEVFLGRREVTGGVVAGPLVAVKTLKAAAGEDGVEAEFRTRFRREIDAARTVTGPHTAALLDGDADARLPWLATEYVPGPALSDAVDRCGPLAVPAVRSLGAGLARALAAVHDARILHRDLKPGNVLLTPDGPRLIDFGIAQAFDATALTATGLLIGTPGYMSPEHLTGSHALVPASDVFCLGAILCFAASGRGPFDDEEPASVLYRIASGAPDLSELPPLLHDVVSRCLAPDPADRLAAAKLAAELSAAPDARDPYWPAPYLSLFAAHREAVERCEQAAGTVPLEAASTSPATAPPPLAVPYSPTAALARPQAPPTVPERPRRRRWWIPVAAVLATALTVTLAALLPGDGSGTPHATASDPAAAGSQRHEPAPLAVPDANAAHSGEFTAEALGTGRRPAGWRPWARSVKGAGRTGGCTAGAGLLVCGDGHGAARALDLATGKEKWRVAGFGADRTSDDLFPGTPPGAPAIAPVTDGTLFYVAAAAGVTAVDAATGDIKWQYQRMSYTGLRALTYARGRLYVANVDDQASAADELVEVQALRTRDGQQMWSGHLPDAHGPLVVRGKTVHLTLADGSPAGLDTTEAVPEPRIRRDIDCTGLLAHDDALLCWSTGRRGIAVLDPRTLATRRTLAGAVTPAAAPVVGDRDIVVVRDGSGRLRGFDWRTGETRWDVRAPASTAALALAGDRVFAVARREIRALDVADGSTGGSVRLPTASGLSLALGPLTEPLVLGGALYLSTQGGAAGSVAAPGRP
ncbi:PQQ-binding-like beta-propeller repeat protein [Streptomyces sp. VRA16 Mangrove soil]|uniref:protein kinase domain-containing protein n=1 Tax=Streptomyces sp. VRA16 Mangrove soil TaxID=2817434 RepID=UPI001A9E9DC7|nr:PQQ-binding-like beta-propeller repeat protein [Streptomyces sp. VRA16 Mangrove soil]MBO1336445.1 PQQ-binding-like beta-propeller repeat protein [Streptomyces sp. VRA16 Mangrove soil]